MRKLITLTITTLYLLLIKSQAAEVIVRGLHEELRNTMTALMKPRLEFIEKRPATEWRADDAAFFLHQLLIKKGYPQSSVKWKITKNNTITLTAKLGTQYTLGKIYSKNTDIITPKTIDDYFTEIITEGNRLKRKNAPYLTEYPPKGAANIENYLKSQGHWDAKVIIIAETKNTNGTVDIKLDIKPGKIHHILPPKITAIPQSLIPSVSQKSAPFIGSPATSENISALTNTIHKHYRDLGYQFATLDISSQNTSGIKITFNINTGNIYKIRNIKVIGNKRTRRSRFNRYISPIQGETYRENEVNNVAKKLLQTGAFKSVRLIPEKINSHQLDLTLQVKEEKPRFIRAYGGIASYDGATLGASYTNQNFFKKLLTLSARSEISSRGLLGEISLTEPYFAGKPIALTARIYALQRRFEGYKKNLSGFETSFKWTPKESITSRLFASIDYVTLNSESITPTELGPNDYLNTKVGLEQIIDFRNSPILPTTGFYARGLLEYGTINGDASNSYFRTDLNTSYRHLLTKNNHRLVLRFSTGTILPSTSSDLPIDLRLFSGGADSVRSFSERELGPLSSSLKPLGGEAYWNSSIEYIHPLNDLFSTSIFCDAGNVFTRTSQYTFSKPSIAAGIGIRLDLPVGPARLEYGYNLTRIPGEPRGSFHFAIGTQF